MTTEHAVVRDGKVVNLIMADKGFAEELAAAIGDDNVDTNTYASSDLLVDISGETPRPGIDWTYATKSKKFSPPPEPVKTKEEKDAEVAAQALADERAADDKFLLDMKEKRRQKKPWTQDERDQVMILLATRGLA